MDWVSKLKWKDLPKYMAARRNALLDPQAKQADSFVKAYNKFKFYWLLQAGHLVRFNGEYDKISLNDKN